MCCATNGVMIEYQSSLHTVNTSLGLDWISMGDQVDRHYQTYYLLCFAIGNNYWFSHLFDQK